MCECEGVSRRRLLWAGVAMGLAGTVSAVLPEAGFAEPDGSGGHTHTITGQLALGAPDWVYLPVEVPPGIREIEVSYRYDRPAVPPGVEGNTLDIGIFDASGFELGNAAGFRGWSGGFRDRFTLSAAAATSGYLPGPIDSGTWHVVLGPPVCYRTAGTELPGQRHVAHRSARCGLAAEPSAGAGHGPGPGVVSR